MTLVEILVAAAILSLLLLAILGIYVMGSKVFYRTDVQSELVSALQVTSARLGRDLRQSVYASLSITPDGRALSCLLPADPEGTVEFDQEGEVEWQSYAIWYHDAATDRVFRRQLPLLPGARQRREPGPLEKYNPGGGARPLRDYLLEGQLVARSISGFRASVPAGTRRLQLSLVALKQAYGKDEPERMMLRTSVRPRN